MPRGIKIPGVAALTALALVFYSLVNFATVGASGGKISTSIDHYPINEGSSQNVELTLDAPIICPGGAPTCDVSLTFASSDPSRASLSSNTVDWNYTEWYQPRYITVNTVNDGVYEPNENITFSATAVSNSVYYNNFLVTMNITLVNLTPPPSPAITDMSATVANDTSITQDVLTGVSGDPDASTLAIISPPSHGTAVDPPGTITYTPHRGYVGTDSLVYQVCSSLDNSVCSTATLSFNVTAAPLSQLTRSTHSTSSAVAPDTGYGEPRPKPIYPSVSYGIASILMIVSGLYIKERYS